MQTKCVIIKTRLRRNITARVYGLVKGHDDLGYVGNNEEKVIDQRHQTESEKNDGVMITSTISGNSQLARQIQG